MTENYSYDSHDHLTAAGGKSYTYDANGNCTSVTQNNLTTSLSYTYDNRISQITYPNSSTNTFQYNGLGLRVQKVDSSGTRNYVCDGASVASTVLSDGSAVYSDGSERRSGVSSFRHTDALGSTRGITNSSQTATDGILLDAFGMTVSRTGSTPTPFGFVGSEQYQTDADSGLMLLGHRYYDPSIGRFITSDPVQDGTNWYAYCGNRPTVAVDPKGTLAWMVVIPIAILVVDLLVHSEQPADPVPPGYRDANPLPWISGPGRQFCAVVRAASAVAAVRDILPPVGGGTGDGGGGVLPPFPVYRGAESGQLPDLTLLPGEGREVGGLVPPGCNGPSLSTDPSMLPGHHPDPYPVEYLPSQLQVVQKGQNPWHYGVLPVEPMPRNQYQDLLNQVRFGPMVPR